MRKWILLVVSATTLLLSACSTPTKYDYSAFKESRPRSILVVMPTDSTTEIKAAPAVLAQAVYPLSEAGYYVFPVALVNETFKHNGLTQAQEIHNVSAAKLQQIFGADAALYINVDEYGAQYQVIDSVVKVGVSGKLVDLRTGKTLWTKTAFASSNENNNGVSANIISRLVVAAISQIVNTVSDQSYSMAGIADARLLSTGADGALLYGPYHPNYGKDPQIQQK